jgi:glutathione S-transferase
MPLKLFYAPRTRATRPRWLLEEMGLPYELVRLNPASKPPNYQALHPLAHVPVLQDGDFALFESAAICLYLAEKDPEQRFSPAPGTAGRAHYYQWMFYVMTELEPQIVSYLAESRRPTEAQDPKHLEAVRAKLTKALDGLAQGLGEKTFLLGERFSAVDVVAGAVLAWAQSADLLGDSPALRAYAERLTARPAYKRARAD